MWIALDIIMLRPIALLALLTIVAHTVSYRSEGFVVQVVEDEIGAENFTYYRLQRSGMLVLELVSLKGDVDIYLSSQVQHPDYDNYELKSDTCGTDIVTVPSRMERPAFVSLFGHPNHVQSKFRLTIYEKDEPVVKDYEYFVNKFERYYYEEMAREISGVPKPPEHSDEQSSERSTTSDEAEDTLPMWWKILLAILEFGIEVIL